MAHPGIFTRISTISFTLEEQDRRDASCFTAHAASLPRLRRQDDPESKPHEPDA
jgi:hypothetical protein